MPFIDAQAPEAPPANTTGINIALRSSGKGDNVRWKVRMTINQEAQQKLFEGNVMGEMFNIQVGQGVDEGFLRLVMCSGGEFEAKSLVKDSISLTIAAWDLLPKGIRPAAECFIEAQPSNVEAIIKLPNWCKPNGHGGKNDSTYGLGQKSPKGSK